jgi:hypothetical protein
LEEVYIKGNIIRIASIKDEFWRFNSIDDPKVLLACLKTNSYSADILTFTQRLPEIAPQYNFYHELYSIAAIPITSYLDWWNQQIDAKTRNIIRKAEKKGITIRTIEFDDNLINGVLKIYNERQERQGKRFPHYGMNFSQVKSHLASYLDVSHFIGAFLKNDLIGFIKLTSTMTYASTMNILSLYEHRDKAPTNALVAYAVKLCEKEKIPFLVYGYWSERGLGNFKKSNGFKKFDLPQYYIPLTFKGKFALKIGLHRGIRNMIPKRIKELIVNLRDKYYSIKTNKNIKDKSRLKCLL